MICLDNTHGLGQYTRFSSAICQHDDVIILLVLVDSPASMNAPKMLVLLGHSPVIRIYRCNNNAYDVICLDGKPFNKATLCSNNS